MSNSTNFARRAAWLLILAFLGAVLIVLPDHLFKIAYPQYSARFDIKAFSVYVLIAALLFSLRARWMFLLAWTSIGLLQLGEFLHFAYFGTLVMPDEVRLLFVEWDEIWETLAKWLLYAAYPIAIVLGAIAAAWWSRHRFGARSASLPLALPILLAGLMILPYRAYQGTVSQAFFPNPRDYALRNNLYAVSYTLAREVAGDDKTNAPRPSFQRYRVERTTSAPPPTIVVVMGESLTYTHMSLFGYDRGTTPWLDSQRGAPDFVARPAIASGVSTKVSLPAFFNVQREPGNLEHMRGYETNLLRLAKQRGMATYYLSVQNANLATYAGTEYADHFVAREDMDGSYERDRDFVLLKYLDGIDFKRPNFIVLHQRNSHGPYEQSSLRRYDAWPVPINASRRDYTINTYDNSIRSTDEFLRQLVDKLRTRAVGPVYVFMTSDHGEMMGETGKYGHNLIDPGVIHVPFVFTAIHGAPESIARIRALAHPTHYEIGLEIARMLGYSVINPNQRPGRYYVSGMDLSDPNNCLAIDKDEANAEGWHPAVDTYCRHGV
jgi:glucan phosphoethanolaminetransferase (alkaline phosphatase superfamily)